MEWKDQLAKVTDVLSHDEIAEACGVTADDLRSYDNGTATPAPEVEMRLSFLARTIERLGDIPDQEKATWLGRSREELDQHSAFGAIRVGEGERVLAAAEKASAAYRERATQEQSF